MTDMQSASMPEITLPSDASGPVWIALHDEIVHRIYAGLLPGGQRLPAVRDLARSLGVNRNTVQRVYRQLTEEKFLETRVGDGTYVRQTDDTLSPQRRIHARRQIGHTLQLCINLGLDPKEVTALVRDELTRIGSDRAQRSVSMIKSRLRFAAVRRYGK